MDVVISRRVARSYLKGQDTHTHMTTSIRALTYSLSVLRYPTDTAHRAARQPGTLAQPVAPRGCLCPSLARTHRTLATLPHAVSEAGSRERFVLRRSM